MLDVRSAPNPLGHEREDARRLVVPLLPLWPVLALHAVMAVRVARQAAAALAPPLRLAVHRQAHPELQQAPELRPRQFIYLFSYHIGKEYGLVS